MKWTYALGSMLWLSLGIFCAANLQHHTGRLVFTCVALFLSGLGLGIALYDTED